MGLQRSEKPIFDHFVPSEALKNESMKSINQKFDIAIVEGHEMKVWTNS